MTTDNETITLKTGIEWLIRNEYGRYVVAFGEAMRAPNGVAIVDPNTYPQDAVDLQPLLSLDHDKEAKEIDKMFRLSQHFKNPIFETIARRIQMLTHLHATVDASFQQTFSTLIPEGASQPAIEQFSEKLQDCWARELRQALMPETTGRKAASAEIIDRETRQGEALNAYLAICRDPRLVRNASATLMAARENLFKIMRQAVGLETSQMRV